MLINLQINSEEEFQLEFCVVYTVFDLGAFCLSGDTSLRWFQSKVSYPRKTEQKGFFHRLSMETLIKRTQQRLLSNSFYCCLL